MTRTRQSAKAAGAAAERAVADHLATALGDDRIDRRPKTGAKDKGDIGGLVGGPVIECKNHRAIDLASFVDEANEEARNADAPFGVAVVKRRGRASAGEGYAVMDFATFVDLLRQAGYGSPA